MRENNQDLIFISLKSKLKILRKKNKIVEVNAEQNKLQSLEIENTKIGFQALLFFAKLHFIDCIFTSSMYPRATNRNNEYSMFLYPFEWEINYENAEETTFVQLQDCSDRENDNNNQNNDIIICELSEIYKKIKDVRINSVYNFNIKDERGQIQFYRIKEIKKIIRVQNMRCYIGYRIHYHLLQMLRKKIIEEKEYLIIGHRKDLKILVELTDCYAVHDNIKKLNLKLLEISDKNDDKMNLYTCILLMKAIVEQEQIDGKQYTVIKVMYPTYLVQFSEWKEPHQRE